MLIITNYPHDLGVQYDSELWEMLQIRYVSGRAYAKYVTEESRRIVFASDYHSSTK